MKCLSTEDVAETETGLIRSQSAGKFAVSATTVLRAMYVCFIIIFLHAPTCRGIDVTGRHAIAAYSDHTVALAVVVF